MMTTEPEKKYRADTIYLRDADGTVWAEVKIGTRVKNRKTHEVSEVVRIEVPTRMVRLDTDVNSNGEPILSRWHPIELFDVVGIPTSPEAMRRRKLELEAELAAIVAEQAIGAESAAPAVPEPPPPPEPSPKAFIPKDEDAPTKPETPKGKGR